MLPPVAIDFETFKIESRPAYPPVPVGVAIQWPGDVPHYYAWGHVSGGNGDAWERNRADSALRAAWCHPGGLLFHNAKFDIDVAETHFGLPRLAWDRYHDAMLLLFLSDPNSREIGLKPAAKRLLGMPPEERDAVADWLLEYQPVPGIKIGRAAKGKNPPGAYIAHAPGDVVAPYACGDVVRTVRLFDLLHPAIQAADMGAAYDRERLLLLLLLDNERRGLRVDTERLGIDATRYTRTLTRVDNWLCRRLGRVFDISAKEQLADALVACGAVTVRRLGVTATGRLKADKVTLESALDDKVLAATLRYRGFLATSLQTFIRPWSAATASTGILHTTWNQVHGTGTDGGVVGTRTGRPSSRDPNFLNIPKEARILFGGPDLPAAPIPLPPLPNVRSYVLPREPGHVIIDRDFASQEPRLLAHFCGGDMLEQYTRDPWTDFHDAAREKLKATLGTDYPRKVVKGINLGLIYGMGVGKMAETNNMPVDETQQLKQAILNMYPGLRNLNREMKDRARRGIPIRTWGGRVYHCEPPVMKGAERISFEYKMVNTLIQGSAADVTKEAMLRYDSAKPAEHELLLQVYDQIVASVPADDLHEGMATLRESMESVDVSVPMLSEGDWSAENWGAVRPYDRKGARV